LNCNDYDDNDDGDDSDDDDDDDDELTIKSLHLIICQTKASNTSPLYIIPTSIVLYTFSILFSI